MNLLAGCVRFDRASANDGACGAILNAQAPAGCLHSLGPAEFGIADSQGQSASRPAQPLVGAKGRLLFVGDVRLDNREDLAAKLALTTASPVGDAELALAAWERWGEATLGRLRGDYAIAVWSADDRRLTLARGPLSPRQIFYRREPNGVCFASIPQALLAAGGSRSLDLCSAARFVGGVAWPGKSTFFNDISRLRHSTTASFTTGATDVACFWEPKRRMEHMGEAEAAGRLAELLDRAVKARLGPGLVAAHLSSGRDSGAVATSAAIALQARDEPLLCYTAAPRSGFAGSGLPGRLDDESGFAAATAAPYPNVRHTIVRPGRDPLKDLDRAHKLLAGPIGTLSNFQWARDIERAAREAGARVMLTGGLGNLTISAGDEWDLLALLREEGVRSWWRAARMFVGSGADYLRLANWTLGGSVPRSLHHAVRWIAGRSAGNLAGLQVLREPHRAAVRAAVAIQTDVRPPSDAFAYRREILFEQDPGDIVSLISGMDVLDPTADVDLIDFCFSIPARLLVGPPGTRPLFDRAFGARLGWPAGAVRPRGYQGADWYLSFTRKRIEEALDIPRRHDLVRELIDLDYVDRMLASWPAEWSDVALMLHYRNDLLRAVSAANYIAVNF